LLSKRPSKEMFVVKARIHRNLLSNREFKDVFYYQKEFKGTFIIKEII